MNTIKTFFTSPTALAFVGLFLDGGLKAVEPSVPVWMQGIIGLVIVIVGANFHFSAVNTAVKTGVAKG